MDTYPIALYTHIAAGSIALATFWTAGLARKGSPLHRSVGKVYLLAMLGVIASGVPLVDAMVARGQQIGALFLTYLLLLVGNGCWSAWRAIRDRTDRARYFGPMYWILAGVVALCGLAIVALGAKIGATLLMVFGSIGVLGGIGAVQSWRRAPNDPKWWLREHYGAMIGNGVATHIAFFAVGLRNAFPGIDPMIVQNLAWFLPLAGALVAGVWLNRRYGRRAAPKQPVGAGVAQAG